MIEVLALPASLRAQLEQEAKSAFPHECCGLIEGIINPLTLSLSKGECKAVALHPMSNLAREPGRFEIDPASHIALLRAVRGTGRAIIGCYHSHPNGRAEPSPHDLAGAGETGFLWLIASLESPTPEPNVACFVWMGSAFEPVHIVSHSTGTGGAG
jgi:desampylase